MTDVGSADGLTARFRAHLSLIRATCGGRAVGRLQSSQLALAISEGLALVLLIPFVHAVGGGPDPQLPVLGWSLSEGAILVLLVASLVWRSWLQWRSGLLATRLQMLTVDTLRIDVLTALLQSR